MEFSNNNKLLMDLKNSIFLPVFNCELYDSITQDSKKCFLDIKDAQGIIKEQPENEQFIKQYQFAKLEKAKRNKRVQLAYLSHRLDKSQNEYWKNGGQLSNNQIQYLHAEEKLYLDQYAQMLRDYEKEICHDYGLDLTKDLNPPTQVYIQVRVVKEIGPIVTSEGTTMDLKKGTQHYVKKSDVEQQLINGSLIVVE